MSRRVPFSHESKAVAAEYQATFVLCRTRHTRIPVSSPRKKTTWPACSARSKPERISSHALRSTGVSDKVPPPRLRSSRSTRKHDPSCRWDRARHRLYCRIGQARLPVSPRTVAKYRPSNLDRQRGQHWTTFIRNQLNETWASDFLVHVTGRFRVLYVLVLSLGRRTIVHPGLTEHPTARRTAQRIAEATSDAQQIPRFLVQDRDSIYGVDFHRRVRGLSTRLLATPLAAAPELDPCGKVGSLFRVNPTLETTPNPAMVTGTTWTA